MLGLPDRLYWQANLLMPAYKYTVFFSSLKGLPGNIFQSLSESNELPSRICAVEFSR